MKVVGITRGKQFSPNMSANDLAIMQEVEQRLKAFGNEVSLISEDNISDLQNISQEPPDAVFTMLRGDEGISCLRHLEYHGIPVLNGANAITNAHRSNITRLLSENEFPIPNTLIIDNLTIQEDIERLEQLINQITFPCWIKNGQGWAQFNDDVAFVQTQEDALKRIRLIHKRYPLGDIIICEHLKGDLVKFYGIEDTNFFYWSYPDLKHSKFGLEAINGKPVRFKFDATKLKIVCDRIAALSGIFVYGGDCVVNAEGDFKIIDFNDWPSFSSCRNSAADAIALRLLKLSQSFSNFSSWK